MKSKFAGAGLLLVTLAVLCAPSEVLSQRGPPGGSDPGRMFDMLSRGRGYFLAEDMRTLRDPMNQWLQKRGITDGKVTRDLFMSFQDEMKSNPSAAMSMFGGGKSGMKGPGGGFPGGGFPGSGFPGGGPGMMPFMPGGGPSRGGSSNDLSPAEIARFGEMEFLRKDYNRDNVLTPEEMEPRLRDSLQTYDSNRDGLISMEEYRGFFDKKMAERNGDGGPKFNPITVIIEDELLDKRPTMFRAGKDMPRELKWFTELDTDQDGQVSFYEWRKGKKDMDDFASYDRNADGLMTAEEALHYQKKNGPTTLASNSSEESPKMEMKMMRPEGNGPMRIEGNKGSGPPRSMERPEGSGKKKGGGPPGGNGNSGQKTKGNFNKEDFAKKMEEWKAKMKK